MSNYLISKKKFISNYWKNSEVNDESIKEGFVALRCYCGNPDCQGWAMVFNTKEEKDRHREMYGKHVKIKTAATQL